MELNLNSKLYKNTGIPDQPLKGKEIKIREGRRHSSQLWHKRHQAAQIHQDTKTLTRHQLKETADDLNIL
jgi:hypothetical protein